jgi:excisionase family DNA binding protein
MARRKGWRAVKSLHSYTIDEAARNQGVSKGTVRRWLKDGLPHLTEQRPFLIVGADLIEFLKSKVSPKRPCGIDEFFCFSCKAVRRAAFDLIEYRSPKPGKYHLRALCGDCSTVMHKAASGATVDALEAKPDVSITMASETISKCAKAV